MADSPKNRQPQSGVFLLCTLLVACSCNVAIAQGPTSEERIQRLERDIDELQSDSQQLKSKVRRVDSDSADAGALIFLFGVFCALWAQNTNRSPWLWFFMGALFSIITVLVLLSKNAADKKNVIRPAAE